MVKDGVVNNTHLTDVGQLQADEKELLKQLVDDYKVPEELITIIKGKMVQASRTKELEALDRIKNYINPPPLEVKRKYRGLTEDGAASVFLKEVYKQELKKGIMNTSILREEDKFLYKSLGKEISDYNQQHPNEQKKLSDYLPTKQDMMQSRLMVVSELFPGVSPRIIGSFFTGLLYQARSQQISL